MRAFGEHRPPLERSPDATRPRQHVLDAARATLPLAEPMRSADEPGERHAWNFGRPPAEVAGVAGVADLGARARGKDPQWGHEPDGSIPESRALVLSSARAASELGWRCAWDL